MSDIPICFQGWILCYFFYCIMTVNGAQGAIVDVQIRCTILMRQNNSPFNNITIARVLLLSDCQGLAAHGGECSCYMLPVLWSSC